MRLMCLNARNCTGGHLFRSVADILLVAVILLLACSIISGEFGHGGYANCFCNRVIGQLSVVVPTNGTLATVGCGRQYLASRICSR